MSKDTDTDTIAIKIKVDASDGTVTITNLKSTIKTATDNIKSNFNETTKSIYDMGREFLRSAGIFASTTILIAGLGAAVRSTAEAAVNFNSNFTQVRTIIDETKVDVVGLEKGILEMGGELGQVGELARGSYMMISSMQRPQTALQDLTAAAKFAQGGQAGLNDAVKAGTGILNAYGDSAGDLTHVYDVLWQVISDGVTTAGELAPAIGRITPQAKEVGLSIEEMAGSIAVMTQISQNTNETITALRGILSSVMKPTKETSDEAERLGINFSSAGIKTMGFAGWLADMSQKVKAGHGDMAKLFPSVEALGGILQLTRNDLQNFNQEMVNMSNVAGNNEKSFQKWKESFNGAWSSVRNEIESSMIQAILPAMKDMAKWLNENGKELTSSVKALVSGISSTISFITKFHDVIILAGEAWLTYFAVTKVASWAKSFDIAMRASSGVLGTLYSDFRMLKAEGLSTGQALSLSMTEAGESIKNTSIHVSSLAGKFKALPTNVKISIALIGAELVGQGLAYIFDQVAKGYEKDMSAIVQSTDAMVKKHSINSMIADFRSLGEAQKKVVDEVNQKLKESESTLTGQEKLYRIFTDKSKLMLQELEKTEAWKIYQKQLDDSKKKTDIFASSADTAKKSINDLAGSIGVLTKDELTKLQEKTAAWSGVLKNNYDGLFNNKTAVLNLKNEVDELIQKYRESGADVPPELKKLTSGTYDLYLATGLYLEILPKVNHGLKECIPSQETLNKILEEGNSANKEATTNYELQKDKLEELSKEQKYIIDLQKSMYAVAGLVTGQFGLLNIAFSNNAAKTKTVGINIEETCRKIEIGLNAFNGLVSVLEKLGLKMNGTTQGIINLGNAAGQIATGILTKDPTAIIGGVVNAIGSIIDLFKKERDWAGEANEIMGNLPGVTEEITKKVAELGKELGSVKMAYRELMGEIIQDTVTSKKSFEAWAAQVMTLFNYIGRYETTIDGDVISYEGVENLNNAFQALVDKVDEFGMRGSKAMIDIIRRAQELGLEVESISSYINNQFTGSNGWIENFNKYVNSMTDNDAWLGVIDENSSFLDTQVQAMVAALTKQGYSYYEIVTMLGDSLTTLGEKAASEGTQLPEYLRQMTDLSAFIQQNQTLIDNIEATRGMMESLGNTNNMSLESFQSFLTQGISNYNALRAAGASEIDTLRIMAPYLQDLQTYAKTYNLTIDEQTQALIDQANAQGLLTGNTMSDSEKQITLLEEIVELLGGKIPYAMEGIANTVATSTAAITGDVEAWNSTLGDVGETIDTVTGKISDMDSVNHEKIIGNTIVADTQLWVGKLIEVDDKIYKIMGSITVGDTTYKKVMQSVSKETSQSWLSAMDMVQNKFNGIINQVLPSLSESDRKALLGMTQNLSGYNTELVALWNQMQTASAEDLPFLQEKYNSVWASMGTETQKIIDLISSYKDVLGIEIPDTLTSLADQYAYIMSAMSASTNQLFLGTDGVLRTLQDIIALQGQVTAPSIGSNYGVFTQEQKVQNSLKFHQLAELWSTSRSTILSDKSHMASFFRDLSGLKGGLLGEDESRYNSFLASITQWNTHIQSGDTWDEKNKKWIQGENSNPNIGIYTQAEKETMTATFRGLANSWKTNIDTILSKETYLRNFINQLDGLTVIDSAKSSYDSLLNQAKAGVTHFQKGEVWDPANDKWILPPQHARGASFIVEQGYPETRPGKNIGVHTGEYVRIYTAAETSRYLSQGYVPAFDPRSGNEINTPYMPNTPESIFDYFSDSSDGLDRLDHSDGSMKDGSMQAPDLSVLPVIIPNQGQSQSGAPREITIRHEVTIRIEGDAGDSQIHIDEKELAREILEMVDDNKDGFTSKLVKELAKYK